MSEDEVPDLMQALKDSVERARERRLVCDTCGEANLDELLCPNSHRRTCVDCCPCHREDDPDPEDEPG